MRKLLLFVIILSVPAALYAASQATPVARVNGAVITSQMLDSAIERLIPMSNYHRNVTEEKRNELRDKALEDLITTELQYQYAIAQGMKADKKQVNKQFDIIRGKFNSKKEFKAALQQAGMTEDQLRAQVEKGLLVQTAIEKTVTIPAAVSEAELKAHYEKNVEKFRQPESMRLRIITASEEGKAAKAAARLKAGEDFGTVAATVSEDNYRVMGGDIGYIHQGRILPDLENAALQMKPGETRGPIKAESNWFLIKLEDRKPERQMSFDESREKLKKDTEKKRAQEFMEKWVSGLRTKAAIEIIKQKN